MTNPLLSTGIPDLDALMGGFQVGDNVIFQAEVGTPPHGFLQAAAAEALRRGDRVFYVSFDHSPATVLAALRGLPPGNLTIVDCFTYGKGRGEDVFVQFYKRPRDNRVQVVPVEMPQYPSQFHAVFDALTEGDSRDCVLLESLTGMAELWRSEERVREFYTHTCPRLFDTRALAVWVLNTRVHTEPFRAAIGHIAQVVITLHRQGDETSLVVERAVGRNAAATYRRQRYVEEGGRIRLEPDAATR